ncbi:MAG: hypothetical protein HZB39_18120 [Planctomycetes bacterium]|nr:hypothetical protein [Planctomycetota bacterium]
MSKLVLAPFCAAVAFASTVLAQSLAPVPLWSEVAGAPAAAVTRLAAERALRPEITGASFVTVDVGALRTFAGGSATRPVFALPLGSRVATLRLDSWQRMWKHTLVRGHVDERGHFLIAFDDAGIAAAAIDVDDTVWSLEHSGTGATHVLLALDHDRMPLHMGCGTDHTLAVAEPPTGAEPASSPAGLNPPTTIDVAVFYTTAARTGAGSAAAMESQIALRIGVASDGAAASGVDHALRLVYTAETAYAETGSTTDLSRFRSTSDGIMDEVHAARTAYGADLMALIINQSSAYCGVGYLMTSLSTGFRTSSFNVTVRGCMTGHTLTHEMGHTMACHHDHANGSGALYPYSYGYRTPDNAYRTIMAYSPGTRVNRWSSPLVTYNGYVMGNAATEDNARSLNQTKATVSAFYATQVYEWRGLDGGVAGLNGEPMLAGVGTKSAAVTPELRITSTRIGAPGVLVFGPGGQNLPIFGGVLVPYAVFTAPVTGAAGTVTFDVSVLRNLGPGIEVVFQAWFVDAAAVQGLSASDALSVTTP